MKTTKSRDDVRREEKRKVKADRFKPQADHAAQVNAENLAIQKHGIKGERNKAEVNRRMFASDQAGTQAKVLHNYEGEWHLMDMNPNAPVALFKNNSGKVRHYCDITRPISVSPLTLDGNSPEQVAARGHEIDKQGDKV